MRPKILSLLLGLATLSAASQTPALSPGMLPPLFVPVSNGLWTLHEENTFQGSDHSVYDGVSDWRMCVVDSGQYPPLLVGKQNAHHNANRNVRSVSTRIRQIPIGCRLTQKMIIFRCT
jgi:hypothetical protein